MAEGLNRAMLIGNLGAEPELRYTQNNRPVLKFRIATTESYMTDSGERKEVTHWHNIVLWGKRGEALSKILTKGTQVYIEGRIENRSYDDKDGVKRNITEITASNLILLGRRGPGEGGGEGGGGGYGGGGPMRGPGGGGGGGGYGGPSRGGPARPAAPAGGGADRDEIPPDDFGGSDDDIPF
jgi:single-strand DNA-binding protein